MHTNSGEVHLVTMDSNFGKFAFRCLESAQRGPMHPPILLGPANYIHPFQIFKLELLSRLEYRGPTVELKGFEINGTGCILESSIGIQGL